MENGREEGNGWKTEGGRRGEVILNETPSQSNGVSLSKYDHRMLHEKKQENT